jgi:hypothetical protein
MRRYAVSVQGKTAGDAGFGRHDIPAGVNDSPQRPKFKGPRPLRFPFTDDEVRSRKVSVARILSFYRAAYTPDDSSPLLGAGDPADGTGSFIGAVGPGKNVPDDLFGR